MTKQQNSTTWVRRAGLGLALVLACVVTSAPSYADSMTLASNTNFFSTSDAENISFAAPGAGTVSISLTDLGWPDALSSLSFSATSATSVFASLATSNTKSSLIDSFDISSAGTFYAHLTARAANLSGNFLSDFGLYSYSITFTPQAAPVPLPASVWLLLGALLALGLVYGRLLRTPVGVLRLLRG